MRKEWKFDPSRPYVFVSYKREDQAVVREVIEAMYSIYGLNIWYDANLTAGKNWDSEALPYLRDRKCKAVILFASTLALTSRNVLVELDRADFYKKVVIPINFSTKPFERLVQEDILDEYNLKDNEKVTVAERMVQKYLDNKLTYLTWTPGDEQEKQRIYGELWRALERNAPEVVQSAREFTAARTAPAKPGPAKPEPAKAEPVKAEPTPAGEETESVRQVTYTLYGERKTAKNQSEAMYDFFRCVLERHPAYIALLTDQSLLQCTSGVDYSREENQGRDVPKYFRICRWLTFPNGAGLCVGTAYGKDGKLRKMAQLLALCGEDPEIFSSDEIELPKVRQTKIDLPEPEEEPVPEPASAEEETLAGGIRYTLYGTLYTAKNQTEVMQNFFRTVLEQHPDCISRLTDQSLLQCTSGVDYTKTENQGPDMPKYFRSSRWLTFSSGAGLCVGTAYGKDGKLRKMAQLLSLCGEDPAVFSSDEVELPKVRPVG